MTTTTATRRHAPLRAGLLCVGLLLGLGAPAPAQEELDFKKLMEAGDYKGLGKKLKRYLDLQRADPELRRYLELNLEFLARGAKPKVPGSELILVRGAKNDQVFRMPPASGGEGLMLPNSIRHMRTSWDNRLPRIDRYFVEATTATGGNGENLRELTRIIEHHKGGGLGTSANSVKSVLISASTVPLPTFGPPFYILKVAPERAIFNHRGLSGEKEVLLPFWILPTEIVAKCNSVEEVRNHPLFKNSQLKDVEFSRWGYGAGGNQNNWAIIEANIRAGRPPLEGVAGLNSYFPGAGTEVGPRATAVEVERFAERIARNGGLVEFVPAGDPRLPAESQARTILGADGRPKVLLREGAPVSKFAMIDELTHVLQLRRMVEARGAAATNELLLRAARGEPAALDVVNRWEIRAKTLLRSMLAADDPARPALERSIRALEAELDPYASARRPGTRTIDWGQIGRGAAGGLAHFSMALFLKELAVVAKTGDRLLVEEFFEGLTKTDFYVHYGLFTVGAMGGDMAYTAFLKRHLDRFVRPQFVQNVLRSNISLAVGMALPELVGGTFQGRAFAINLAGLGLSSTAVKAGVAGIRWVVDLKRIPQGARLAERLGRMSRLTSVAGFTYHAVETAVVLYWGDKIAREIDAALERRQARERVREAADAVLRAQREGGDVRAALDAYADANREYRDVLARDVQEVEAILWDRLNRAGVSVKESDDALRRYRELAAQDPGRYAALLTSAERLAARREAEFREEVARIFEAYDARFGAVAREVYGPDRTHTARATDDAALWALRGAAPGGAGDPWGGRTDVFAGWGRDRATSRALDLASDLPTTRLAAYDAEAAFYEAMARAYAGDPEAVDHLRERAARARETRDLDRAMVLGDGPGMSRLSADAEAARGAAPDENVRGFLDALNDAGVTDR